MSGVSDVRIPLRVRLNLARAAIQTIADTNGVDLLHIKGDAVDDSLRPGRSAGSDVDVLVRPVHVGSFDTALRAHGWRVYSTFDNGSPFGHAQTYVHDVWGYLDVHRSFPGIRRDAREAFDVLGAHGRFMQFAGVGCRVPGRTAQALILILNAARASGSRRHDVVAVWESATDDGRAEIAGLVTELDATVGFAAATGRLDEHRRAPDYLLWKAVTQGGSRAAEWWGRVRAEPTVSGALRVAGRAMLVNSDRLEHQLGRPPRRRDVAVAFIARPARALREAWRSIARRLAR